MIENINEIWLPIDGFDGYEVSNYGRIKSLNYNKTKQEQILKQDTNKKGYQRVCLYKDRKRKKFLVHRLVANAFIDNPNNYEQVNHKDEVKTNNYVDNLEWCDCKYNINYGTVRERISKAMSGENHPKPMLGRFGKDNPTSKQVIQLSLENEVIKIWGSAIDVQRELGYHNSAICNCCKGKRKSANGYKWQYA